MCSGVLEQHVVEILPFPLLRLLSFTTICTTACTSRAKCPV